MARGQGQPCYKQNQIMKLAVKTKQRAVQVLNRNHPDSFSLLRSIVIEQSKSKCECGETLAFLSYRKGVLCGKVTVCEQCGDDDRFDSDVLYTYE